MIHVRTIDTNDAEAFWKLRLLGLRLNPEAFYASYEESVNETMENVSSRMRPAEDRFIVGAFTEQGELAGIAGFRREERLKLRHKGEIWGVFVAPEFRRMGIGRLLIREILVRANKLEGLSVVGLSTMAENEAAKRLYQSLGFEPFGTERKALKVGGRFLDEVWMSCHLDEMDGRVRP
jgi:RimJ/RimL family protein N-acetyltransferase